MKKYRFDAIRSAWAVARTHGLAAPAGQEFTAACRMSHDDAMRRAMVRCWECGYRAALRDARKGKGRTKK